MPGLLTLPAPARRVLEALTDAGGRPLIVGGTVRDAIRDPGIAPKDLDIEVYGLPVQQTARALARVAPVGEVGRSFAVLKVRHGGMEIDVSLPRREVKTGSGHRGFSIAVDPHASIEASSARRDFTLNALAFDPATQEVIDCWSGLDDLRSGVLRHTSPAFSEDPLRVLRAAGFAARFGFTLHQQTAELARDLHSSYSELSLERVWGEWHKIVSRGSHISAALQVLVDTGWISHFPQLDAMRGIEQPPTWHPEGDVFTHAGLAADAAATLAGEARLSDEHRTAVVLAALLHDVGKVTHTKRTLRGGVEAITSHGHDAAGVEPARAFLRSIGAPKSVRDVVAPLVREHMVAIKSGRPSRSAVRRLARRLVPATTAQWSLVVDADHAGRGSASQWGASARWLEVASTLSTLHSPVTTLLTGRDVMAAGVPAGPDVGQVLRAATTAQDGGAFDDRTTALAWLQRNIAAQGRSGPRQ